MDIAKEAGANGYKEIQFDYMRFPSDGNVTACVFPKYDGRTKEQVITEFIAYLRDNLKPEGLQISGDVFGLIASDQGTMGIGQDVTTLGQYMDYLCPMVYPSHYNRGEYNISVPEANPHDVVFLSLEDFKKDLAETNCKLRPWLQDFSISIPTPRRWWRPRYRPATTPASRNGCCGTPTAPSASPPCNRNNSFFL